MATITRYVAMDKKNNLYYLSHHHGWFTHNRWTVGVHEVSSTIIGVGHDMPNKDIKVLHESTFNGFHLFIKKKGEPHKITHDIIISLWKLHKWTLHKLY
ncbi:MAG: hypothetical protein V1725_07985 [archaeon]